MKLSITPFTILVVNPMSEFQQPTWVPGTSGIQPHVSGRQRALLAVATMAGEKKQRVASGNIAIIAIENPSGILWNDLK